MKVLFLVSWLSRANTHSEGSFFFDQAKILRRNGHEPSFLCLRFFSPGYGRKKIQLSIEGFECTYISRGQSCFVRESHRQFVKRCSEEINRLSPQGLIFGSLLETYPLLDLPIVSECGAFIQEHSSSFLRNGWRPKGWNISRVIQKVNQSQVSLFAVSHALAGEMSSQGFSMAEYFNVLPKVDMDSDFRCDKRQIDVLWLGRNDDNKRPEMAEQILGNLGAKGFNCLLITDESYVQRNECSNVEIRRSYGKLDRREVAELFRNTDTVLITSRFETFGLMALEGLSNGCKVVSSDNGGVTDLSLHPDLHIYSGNEVSEIAGLIRIVVSEKVNQARTFWLHSMKVPS